MEVRTPSQASSRSPDLVPDSSVPKPSSDEDIPADSKRSDLSSESFASATSETSKEAELIVNEAIFSSLAVVKSEALNAEEPVGPREVESDNEPDKNGNAESDDAAKPRSVTFAANVQQVEISPRPSESSEEIVPSAPPAELETVFDTINTPEVAIVPPSPVQTETPTVGEETVAASDTQQTAEE